MPRPDPPLLDPRCASTNDKVTKQLSASGVATLALAYDRQGQVSAIGRYNAAGTAVSAAMCLRHDPLGRVVLVGTTGAIAPGGTACLVDAHVTSAKARFKYDHANRRQGRWLSSTNEWTYVVSDAAGNPLSEVALTATTPATWAKVRDYVWLDGRPIAQIEYGTGGAQARPYYLHVDHIGLPRGLTNQAGQLVWSAAARPYGDLVETTTVDPLSGRTVVTNLRLPGQYDERLLGSLGLQGPYYNWNRWYLPGLGRYLEVDPIAAGGGFNGVFGPDWYGYAGQGPMLQMDPTGEFPVYGGYCGEDYTGRQNGPYSPDKEKDYRPPYDKLDAACRVHDICYYNCRQSHPCDKDARSACFRQCDYALTASALEFGGLWGRIIGKAIDRPGKRDPGPNDKNCGCK